MVPEPWRADAPLVALVTARTRRVNNENPMSFRLLRRHGGFDPAPARRQSLGHVQIDSCRRNNPIRYRGSFPAPEAPYVPAHSHTDRDRDRSPDPHAVYRYPDPRGARIHRCAFPQVRSHARGPLEAPFRAPGRVRPRGATGFLE